MKFRYLFFLSLSFMIWACGNEGEEATFTPAGYKYVMHIQKEGTKPNPGDYVYFHAQTRNGDKVMNSSRQSGRGTTPFLQITRETPVNQQISPVQELLRIMSVGDSVTIYIPLDTLLPEQKPVGFKDADFMLYDMVMLEIKTPEQFQASKEEGKMAALAKVAETKARFGEVKAIAEESLNRLKSGALDKDLIVTESGLKLYFNEKTDKDLPPPGVFVKAQYVGMLMDGTIFDNTFQRGEAISFQLGQGGVIPGWEEAFLLIPEGSKALMFVPYNLAYGASGNPPVIPGKSDLVFYIELEKVN